MQLHAQYQDQTYMFIGFFSISLSLCMVGISILYCTTGLELADSPHHHLPVPGLRKNFKTNSVKSKKSWSRRFVQLSAMLCLCCLLQLEHAMTIRKPWGPLEVWASIPLWVKRMRMAGSGYMETHHVGDLEWFTLAVAKPCKIPAGTFMWMQHSMLFLVIAPSIHPHKETA